MLGLVWLPAAVQAQEYSEPRRPLAAVIDEYVREGLASNLSLQAQSLEVERATAALDEARARYFPDIGLAARYSKSDGGRTIEIPNGTMLNPVYQTLNEMLMAQGQPPRFPALQNESIAFLRETEQDTRLTMRMPLIAPAIPAAVRAQRELLGASEYARTALARRLKRDITVGYLRWLGSVRNQGIVDASVALLDENLRVNDSLFRNGKITQDQVLRARAELLQVEQQSRDARNLAAQAQSFLNFLLNRPLDTPLENAEVEANITATTRALAELRQAALDNRPELAQLARLTRASEAQTSVARAELWPTLSFGADGGIQGEEYEFGRGSNFYTVSLLLNWNLFDGGARRAEVRQSDAIARRTATQPTSSPSRCSSKFSSRSTGSTPAPTRWPPPKRAPRPRAPASASPAASVMKASSARSSSSTRARASRAPSSISTSRVSKCSRARPSSTTPLPRALCRWMSHMRTRTSLLLFTRLDRRLRHEQKRRWSRSRRRCAFSRPSQGPGGTADRHQRPRGHQG